ncbi:hypothetical protein AURDEDRAFT_109579 [Auricularia subglabra TFB-10046 SS5]|nr:hypothetical protein AURDEDRAFT_109579 [Auricularia subglabra TFB-10046 SS5]
MESSPARQQSPDGAAAVAAPASGPNQATPAPSWTPSPNAAPFYPSFTPFFAPGQPPPQAQQQFYDPNFAQWAYHQMILSQPHLMNPQAMPFTPPGGAQQLPQPAQPLLAPFPNPSPRPSPSTEQAAYQGFHPYRRPGRPQQDAHGHHGAQQSPAQQQLDWSRQQHPPQPPYARGEASSSQTSLGGSSTSSRSRVNSNGNSTPPSSVRNRPGALPPPAQPPERHAPPPAVSNFGRSSPVPANRAPHQRVNSSSSDRSSGSTTRGVRPASPALSHQSRPSMSMAPAKPSPLSQGQSMSTAEKRMSKDDSELISESAAHAAASPLGRPSGLKGRLRRAFSFNAANTLETGASTDSRLKAQPGQAPVADPDAPGAPPKRSRAASLFNPRFNRSTDNISLSSTVSSASVMIRKLGSMGKLARRNTLAGITSIFKDKNKEGDSKSRAEPTVSHATAEFDRIPSASDDPEMVGLSPAAQLVRQHTLRSNAQEAAERAKAALDRRAAAAGGSQRGPGPRHIYEDGRRIIVEEEDEDSGSDTDRGHRSDDDADGLDEEDLTVRMNNTGLDDDEDDGDDYDTWAVGIRRSIERIRQPAKGILKNAGSYDQDAYLQSVLKAAHPSQSTRPRSNSYGPASQESAQPGPLARIPSPDPDHIDGLHGHKDGVNPHLPRFSFELSSSVQLHASPSPSPPPSSKGHSTESMKDKSPYNHPAFNSSAPVLSLGFGGAPLVPRAATAPAKRIVFAPNLSIYDTFSPAMYDRRSEPATCNRLTPALAQRIKEELNSYKMEEMEVHVESRVHTHFFV